MNAFSCQYEKYKKVKRQTDDSEIKERMAVKIQMIEETVKEVADDDQELFAVLIKSVTTNIPIIYLDTELSEITIKRKRKEYFYLLDKKL